MRAVVTRVLSASVAIGGAVAAEIEKGFLVLLGVHRDDTPEDAKKLADRVCGLRVFEDENGKMNLNLAAAGGSILCVSQFTLFADTSSRRPGLPPPQGRTGPCPSMSFLWRCAGAGALRSGTGSLERT